MIACSAYGSQRYMRTCRGGSMPGPGPGPSTPPILGAHPVRRSRLHAGWLAWVPLPQDWGPGGRSRAISLEASGARRLLPPVASPERAAARGRMGQYHVGARGPVTLTDPWSPASRTIRGGTPRREPPMPLAFVPIAMSPALCRTVAQTVFLPHAVDEEAVP